MSGAGAAGSPEAERRGRWLLVAGALAGIALTAWGLVGSGDGGAPREGAVALVNGQPLPREAFDRFVEAVAAERKTAVLPLEERQRMLDRLIDEELLLQHGLRLGLGRHEPTARRMIVQSVIESVTAAAEARVPEESELRDYYARNPDRFVRPGRFEVEAVSASVVGRTDAEARALAERAAETLRGGATAEAAAAALEGVERPPLPGGPLPLETVRRYLGPTAALRTRELAAGEVCEPFRASAGYLVLRLVARTPDRVPPFEEVAEQVRAEWVRSRGEEALARFLAELRGAADVWAAPLDGDAP